MPGYAVCSVADKGITRIVAVFSIGCTATRADRSSFVTRDPRVGNIEHANQRTVSRFPPRICSRQIGRFRSFTAPRPSNTVSELDAFLILTFLDQKNARCSPRFHRANRKVSELAHSTQLSAGRSALAAGF